MQGIALGGGIFSWDEIDSSNIYLQIINDRICISATFYDLRTEEIVGIIKNNEWTLYKSEFIDYSDTNNKFEVIDKSNNLIFSLTFQPPNNIIVT